MAAALLVAGLLVAGLAGCAAGAAPDTPAGTTPATSAAPPAALHLDERDNGRTVHARPAQIIRIELHSSYWGNVASSAPPVLRPDGGTVASPGRCPPGVGCGTFRTAFVAGHPGTARLTAARTVCGEALACRPDQRSLAITVVVDPS
jgi:hypothetical protein